jgi:membrane-bound lytic murein transglycosylase D
LAGSLRSDTIAASMTGLAYTAVLLLATGPLGSASGRAVAAPAAPKGPRSSPPVEESLSERRAVRGVPVDDSTIESPELRELRRFEEQTFPRGAALSPATDDGAPPAPPALPGRWGGSGDVPPELRSPGGATGGPPPPAAAPAPPDSEWLRALKVPELPVRWDPQTLRYLDYFRSDPKGRAVMASWLRRAGRFRDLFEKKLERQGLPKDLFYVAMVESGFDTSARSRAGAGGIWQFMPSAARAYGLEVSYWVDGRRDPERAAEAAARYLKDLYVRFGSWYLVFAAYNAGYGAVLRSITSYNTNDFWELVRHEAGLPWESSIYVPKILATAVVGHNLGAFGFGDVAEDAPFAYEEVEAPPGTTLATIARAAGSRLEVIEALNPQLVRDRTPPDRPASRVRIPPGAGALYAESLDRSRTAADRLETVVLRFGETLDDVAKARGLGVRELRRLNGVKDSLELRAGMTIVAPKVAKPKPDAVAAADEDDTVLVAVPERTFSYEGRERVFYRTRDGDALGEIADTFGVRADELVEWNNLDPDAKLHARMVLQIYVSKDFDREGIVLLDPAKVRVVTLGSEEFLELEAARRGKTRLYYTTKAGDTLARVGRRYGLTPGDLARINRFSYSTELHEGERIVVYSPTGQAPREVSMGRTPEPKRPGGVGRGKEILASPKKPRSEGKGETKSAAKPEGKAVAKADTKPDTKPDAKPEGRAAAARAVAAKSPVPALAGKKK